MKRKHNYFIHCFCDNMKLKIFLFDKEEKNELFLGGGGKSVMFRNKNGKEEPMSRFTLRKFGTLKKILIMSHITQ